jgi:hypothetical protein
MTIDDIRKAVKHIEGVSGDPEAAHSKEDDLYHAFVKHIAKSEMGNFSIMAKEVLKTEKIKFSRWCA